jgi:hypothetical protein
MSNLYKSAHVIAQTVLRNLSTEITREVIQEELEKIFTMYPAFKEVDLESLINQLEQDNGITESSITQLIYDNVQPWLYKTDIDYKFWSRYETYLRMTKPSFPVASLDKKTSQILDNCMNPLEKGTWSRRGMVVGNVQSGKTANYVGLINKAIDSGYKLIIVFAGVHNTLRAQTQDRIDEGVIGRKSADLIRRRKSDKYGVGEYSLINTRSVYSYTCTPYPVKDGSKSIKHGDFDINKARELNVAINGTDPTVLVVKKNKTILENLIVWLEDKGSLSESGFKKVTDVPLFVIDDEADNASVNSGKDDIKTINRLIRTLLHLFTKNTFIGFTATPYANLFISDLWDPNATSIVKNGLELPIGPDLFPKHFIINIHASSDYIGADKIFGFENSITGEKKEPLDLVRLVNDQEPCFPKKLNKENKNELPVTTQDLPESLRSAVKSFILSCAIRRHRGQIKIHNSMLVHVALYVAWIDRVADIVNKLVIEYKNQINSGQGKIIHELKQIFETDFAATTKNVIENLSYKDSNVSLCAWPDVEHHLKEVVKRIQVRAVHGVKKGLEYDNTKELNYDDYDDGLTVIAVGGNKLARGITLEGLTISYYLRTTKMYDSLMQMGRWFGYRHGYVDLCRLYTTNEIRVWYRHVTMATEDMRQDFDELTRLKGVRPDQFQLKVLSHPGLLSITSLGKMRGVNKLTLGFSGTVPQTYSFPKNESVKEKNHKLFLNLVQQLDTPIISQKGSRINQLFWNNIPANKIFDFLNGYQTDQPNINSDAIVGYIKEQNKNGRLLNWDLAIRGSSERKIPNSDLDVFYEELVVNGNKYKIGRPYRTLADLGDSLETGGRSMAILDKSARMLGLGLGDKNISEEIISARRAELEQPLLVLYPLDPRKIDPDSNIPIIGFGIIFPKIEGEIKLEYAVRPIEELVDSPHEDDDDNDDDD